MSIIAWIVLGAIAGYLAGFLVRGDEGLGIIGHIVLGVVGALVGGFLAGVLFNTDPIDGALDVSSIVVATIGAIITVVVVSALTGRTRTGRTRSTSLSHRQVTQVHGQAGSTQTSTSVMRGSSERGGMRVNNQVAAYRSCPIGCRSSRSRGSAPATARDTLKLDSDDGSRTSGRSAQPHPA